MIIIFMTLITFAMVVGTFMYSSHLLESEESAQFKDSYECGFSSWRGGRMPFSLRFFLLTVLFLIFDIELVILFPIVWVTEGPMIIYFLPLIIFMFIIIVGLLHEMSLGALDWENV